MLSTDLPLYFFKQLIWSGFKDIKALRVMFKVQEFSPKVKYL